MDENWYEGKRSPARQEQGRRHRQRIYLRQASRFSFRPQGGYVSF